MAEIEAIKIGGGALVGAIAAVLGIKKIIKQEICEGIKPTIEGLQKDIDALKQKQEKSMSTDQHKLICQMNGANVTARFDAIRDHIDIKFEELNKRLDQRRGGDGK